MVEKFNQVLTKAIQTAHLENKCWQRELYTFLRNYRATPHSATGKSPAELLYRRKLTTTLPAEPVKTSDPDVEIKDRKSKHAGIKLHEDRGAKINVGDKVLVKQQKKNKLTPAYNPQPMTVTKKHHTKVTADSGRKSITRDVSHFKLLPKCTPVPEIDISGGDTDDDEIHISPAPDYTDYDVEEDINNDINQDYNPPPVEQTPPPQKKQYPQRNRQPPNYFTNSDY